MEDKEKKRLMIVIWNMGVGGVQKRVRDVILDILINCPEWTVYLVVKSKKPNFFLQDIKKVKNSNRLFIYYHLNENKKTKPWPSTFWIAKKYLKINPTVCLTFLDQLSVTMAVLKSLIFWRKCKLVLNEGILTSTYLNIYREKKWLWKLLIRYTYRFADAIIVPTNACKNDLVNNFNIKVSLIKVIPNWTLFKPISAEKYKYDLIFVGRLEKEKNIFQLTKVLIKLKRNFQNIKLCLVGNGSQKSKLKKCFQKHNLTNNVIFLGCVKNVAPVLQKSKVMVLPTINEGLPNVVLEAAMCQVPAVINRFSGCTEVIINKKTGFISSDAKQMINNVNLLLKDDLLREKMGKNAQVFVTKLFSVNNQKKFINALFS